MESNLSINNGINRRAQFTVAVSLYVVLHLSIEFFTGGVRVHYPLMRDDLPALSNWWGLIVLPFLAWVFYAGMKNDTEQPAWVGLSTSTLVRLAMAFAYGWLIGGTFTLGFEALPGYLFFALIGIGIGYPLYRPEVMLGLILGMTFTFGAVIPTVVIGIVALSSLLLNSIVLFLIRKLRSQSA